MEEEAGALAAADEAPGIVVGGKAAGVRSGGRAEPLVHLGRLAHEVRDAVLQAQRPADSYHCIDHVRADFKMLKTCGGHFRTYKFQHSGKIAEKICTAVQANMGWLS